jgi:UDP-glucose 4-epimerase
MTFKFNSKNVLVTGGTGQVGSFLVESLIKHECNITVLGRNSEKMKEIKPLVEDKKIEFIECDLTDEKSVESIKSTINETDYLVHLSSEFSSKFPTLFENAQNSVDVNLRGTIQLLKFFERLEGVLYASTIAVYGQPKYHPIDENHPTDPVSFYACGKLGAEKFLRLYCNSKKIPVTILRYSSVYGPRNRSKQPLSTFIEKALLDEPITVYGMGKGYRDFIYISDVVEATINAITKNQEDIYNIGSGTKCTIEDLAKMIIDLTCSKSRIILSDRSKDFDFVCDISKAKHKLGFTPTISLVDGLAQEIKWHRTVKT